MTPEEIQAYIRQVAQQRGVDPDWAIRLANQESRFNPRAVSSVGAQGVMQLMPGTARDLGVTDSFDPRQNIDGGIRYMRQLSDRYQGDQVKASAAYNWGMGNVDRQGLDRMPAETRNYIQKVAQDNDPYADLLPGRAKPDDDPYIDLLPKREQATQAVAAKQASGFAPSAERQSEAVPESLGGRIAASAGSMLADAGLALKQRLNEQFLRNKNSSIGGQWVYDKLGYDPQKVKTDLEAQVAEKRALDKPLLDSQGGTTGRILGGLGLAVPSALIPGAQSLGGSIATGAALGALEPTEANNSVGLNSALGALAGAGGYGLSKAIGSGVDAIRRRLPSNRVANPQAAQRLREAQDFNVDLTAGQVARDPIQWAAERNIRGLAGGEEVMSRLTEQNQRLIEGLNGIGAGRGAGRYATGEQSLAALSRLDAAKNKAVDQAYETARNTAGVDTPLNAARLMDQVTRRLDEAYLGDKLPPTIRSALNEAGQGGAEITVGKAAQMQRMLNSAYGADKTANNAYGLVKDVIDNEIAQTSPVAGAAFRTARATAASRFNWQDAVPAAKALANKEATPDEFFAKYIANGNVVDIRNTMKALPLKEKVGVQNQMLDLLKNKALNGASDETGSFSQAAYNRQLQSLGRERLIAVLGLDKTERLFKLGRVAESALRPPANATVSTSNSNVPIMNALGRGLGLPIIGPNIVAPLQNLMTRRTASQALNGNNGIYSRPEFLPPMFPQYMPNLNYLSGAAASGGMLGAN